MAVFKALSITSAQLHYPLSSRFDPLGSFPAINNSIYNHFIMTSSISSLPIAMALHTHNLPPSMTPQNPRIRMPLHNVPASFRLNYYPCFSSIAMVRSRSLSSPQATGEGEEGDEEEEFLVQDLRVPDLWLVPSKALEESEWLKVNLHKWLDDEYCPEPTNVVISKVAARSYYESLLEKETEVGEILLRMARDLESVSYQESFHGAFSAANAAVSLILERLEEL